MRDNFVRLPGFAMLLGQITSFAAKKNAGNTYSVPGVLLNLCGVV
jgi:hypothetical protein